MNTVRSSDTNRFELCKLKKKQWSKEFKGKKGFGRIKTLCLRKLTKRKFLYLLILPATTL